MRESSQRRGFGTDSRTHTSRMGFRGSSQELPGERDKRTLRLHEYPKDNARNRKPSNVPGTPTNHRRVDRTSRRRKRRTTSEDDGETLGVGSHRTCRENPKILKRHSREVDQNLDKGRKGFGRQAQDRFPGKGKTVQDVDPMEESATKLRIKQNAHQSQTTETGRETEGNAGRTVLESQGHLRRLPRKRIRPKTGGTRNLRKGRVLSTVLLRHRRRKRHDTDQNRLGLRCSDQQEVAQLRDRIDAKQTSGPLQSLTENEEVRIRRHVRRFGNVPEDHLG